MSSWLRDERQRHRRGRRNYCRVFRYFAAVFDRRIPRNEGQIEIVRE